MVRGTVQRLVFVTVLGVLASLTVHYFNIHLGNKTLDTQIGKSLSLYTQSISFNLFSIGFSNESFDIVMATAVPLLALIGALSLAIEVLCAFLRFANLHRFFHLTLMSVANYCLYTHTAHFSSMVF